MPQNESSQEDPQLTDSLGAKERLREVAAVFLKLGATAFGGPAAHIAMMDDEIVKKRKWVDRQRFLDLLGAANLIPGPNSTELAIHLGYVRAGWLGLLAAGCCFIAPAMVIVMLFAFIYERYHALPELTAVLYGIKPVIVAIVLQALLGLGKTACKNTMLTVAAISAFILNLTGASEIGLLFVSGIAVMFFVNRRALRNKSLAIMAPIPWLYPFGEAAFGSGKTISLSLFSIFVTFLKIGSVLYGSGYVLLAFLQSEFVERLHALTSQQILDAVAVGQFTPGPVFTTATFIGYVLDGPTGALVATVAIFLPAFVFVALTNRWIPKLRRSAWLSAFLDGVNAASFAIMAAVSIKLAGTAVVDVITVALALVSLLLLIRFKVNATWLILGGTAIGLAAYFADLA